MFNTNFEHLVFVKWDVMIWNNNVYSNVKNMAPFKHLRGRRPKTVSFQTKGTLIKGCNWKEKVCYL